MAKSDKSLDGVDDLITLFPAGSIASIERLLQRAREAEAKQAGRDVVTALRSMSVGNGGGGSGGGHDVRRELVKALRHRPDTGRGKASIRVKAADGGRSFHFAHSIAKRNAGLDATSAPEGSKGGTRSGRAARHMRYIERDGAVEVAVDQHRDRDREAGLGRRQDDGSWDREIGDYGVAAGQATGAAPGQSYIENPAKIERAASVAGSFGTIGDTAAERIAFWEALEEAEPHPDARIQHRLILELPHEASAVARLEMMKQFCQHFDRDKVPYWVALHAPGKKNDSRNYHAHIVYSERPAVRMSDPTDPSRMRWDFEIVETYRTASRNVRKRRPYRQNKIREYHKKDFIPRLRGEFCDIVNQVLERDSVTDAAGAKVRYDARSYKDMGIDVVPLASINRIAAKRMNDGTATNLDEDYTKRQIAAALLDAAARRDRDLLALVELERTLDAATKAKNPSAAVRALPPELRGTPLLPLWGSDLAPASRGILLARRRALQIDVMESATTSALERVIAATAPQVVEAASRARDPAQRAEVPSAESAALLHAAAIDELTATKASVAAARRSARLAVDAAMKAWKDLVNPPPPTISPAVMTAVLERDLHEGQANRGATQNQAVAGPANRELRTEDRPATRDATVLTAMSAIKPGAEPDPTRTTTPIRATTEDGVGAPVPSDTAARTPPPTTAPSRAPVASGSRATARASVAPGASSAAPRAEDAARAPAAAEPPIVTLEEALEIPMPATTADLQPVSVEAVLGVEAEASTSVVTSGAEDPDDVRRRKKRDEEVKKRKSMRKAVLGRRNSERGR